MVPVSTPSTVPKPTTLRATAISAASMVFETTTARGISLMSPISAIRIAAIIISAAAISATVILVLKTSPVKATAVKIPGIPPFKERPVVGIVVIIPVVAVPGWIVIVRIPGEFVLIHYTILGGIAVGVGIGALIRRVGFLVDRSR